jgi:hypothetical protein
MAPCTPGARRSRAMASLPNILLLHFLALALELVLYGA